MKEIKQTSADELSIKEIQALVKEQITKGKGLISYRNHLLLLKKLKEKQEMLLSYRKSLVSEVDKELNKVNEAAIELRNKIEIALREDNSIPKTEAGGKSIILPDVGSATLSKEIEKVIIEDAEKLMEALGEDFVEVKRALNKKKAKMYLEETGRDFDGAKKVKEQILTIKFK